MSISADPPVAHRLNLAQLTPFKLQLGKHRREQTDHYGRREKIHDVPKGIDGIHWKIPRERQRDGQSTREQTGGVDSSPLQGGGRISLDTRQVAGNFII